jgi:hypothetical protein
VVESLLLAALLTQTVPETADTAEDVAVEAAEPEAAVPEAAVPEPAREDAPSGVVSLLDYQIAQVNRLDVASGRTKVSVESNAPSPRTGSFPVRFFVDNTSGPRQVINLSIRSSISGGMHLVTRSVEVNAGERRTVNVPVPSEMRYGTVRAEGPGITEDANASMYFQATYDPQRVVLSISRPEQFEKYVGKAPRYSGANVQVHAIPPGEAPGELASYLGYDAIVVPDGATLDTLDEAQRRALEAYVATGGHLIVGGSVRSPAIFPLLKAIRPGTSNYGFGKLIVTTGTPSGSLDVFREGFPVSPHGSLPEYERRYNTEAKKELLLPQATAPLGRFLFIITLFTLAIGPGSVWVARRRGPAALLVTIPGTAILTCAMIISYSVIADGFTVHTSSYGFTLLDSRNHRAITQGITAYYANLAPSKASYGPSTMLIAPHEDRREKYVADLAWKDGLTLGGDFVPSRTYREWGFVSVEPTRARLVVKRKGEGYVAQNALGVRIERVVVDVDGRFFTGGPIRDGGEEALVAGNTLTFTGSLASSRFSADVSQAVAHRDLQHHEFLARIVGETLVPTGGISTRINEAEDWVRGEFEE